MVRGGGTESPVSHLVPGLGSPVGRSLSSGDPALLEYPTITVFY